MNHMTLNEALDDYYAQKCADLSAITLRGQESILERWRTWVTRETTANVYLADVDSKLMARYFMKLRPPAVAESTYNNYRQYLKRFWDYCREEDYVRINPMRHIDPLKVQKKERLRLSADECQKMLDLTEDPRDRIALSVGMNTGLRGCDVMSLKIGDVNLGDNVISAQIKKTRDATEKAITSELRAELFHWYEAYAEGMGLADMMQLPNDWWLVPPRRGKAMKGQKGWDNYYLPTSEKPFQHPEQILHRALARIGLDKKGEGFHTLRRTSGRIVHDLAAAKGSRDALRVAQAFYDHKTRRVTEDYIGIHAEKKELNELLSGQSLLGEAARIQQDKNDMVEASLGELVAPPLSERRRAYA
jgi:integrase